MIVKANISTNVNRDNSENGPNNISATQISSLNQSNFVQPEAIVVTKTEGDIIQQQNAYLEPKLNSTNKAHLPLTFG